VSSTALWYLSRSTGFVLLILLSLTAVLGVVVHRRGTVPGMPSFAVTGLHRNASLLAIVLLTVHVTTAVVDPYVPIQWWAVLIPFTSHYEALWLGLGALTLDLILALVVTSLIRERLGGRTWRAIHFLAYLAYPLAVVHGIGAASDLQSGVLLALTIACVTGVAVAAGWRLVEWRREAPAHRKVLVTLAAVEAAGTSMPARGQ
jgi:sulfoxide reductase heme-binding subunit YedZ